MSQSSHQRRVNPEVQQKARRQLVVMLTSVFFVILPTYPSILLATKLLLWFGIGPTLNEAEALIFVIVFLILFFFGATISSILWRFLMSFYLTIEELQQLDKIRGPRMLFGRALFTKITQTMLDWKIAREGRKDQVNSQ